MSTKSGNQYLVLKICVELKVLQNPQEILLQKPVEEWRTPTENFTTNSSLLSLLQNIIKSGALKLDPQKQTALLP